VPALNLFARLCVVLLAIAASGIKSKQSFAAIGITAPDNQPSG
jgi:hypothetical protein